MFKQVKPRLFYHLNRKGKCSESTRKAQEPVKMAVRLPK